MRSAFSRARAERGFTLLELMVVLAIVGLVMASFPLALNRMLPSRQLALETDRVVGELQKLQHWASTRNEVVVVKIKDSALVAYSGSTQLRLKNLSDDIDLSFNAPWQRTPLPQIAFYPDGSASAAVIRIERAGRCSQLAISSLTSRIARETRPCLA